MEKPILLPGDIGFLMHHDNVISKAISGAMGSKWSHAFLVREHTLDWCYLIETTSFEVVTGDLDVYLEDPNVSLEIWRYQGLSDSQRMTIVKNARKHLGEIYGYLQLFSLGLRRLMRALIGWEIKNLIRSGLVCCHVVFYGYFGSNVPLLGVLDPEGYDTEELYEIIQRIGFVKVMEKTYRG